MVMRSLNPDHALPMAAVNVVVMVPRPETPAGEDFAEEVLRLSVERAVRACGAAGVEGAVALVVPSDGLPVNVGLPRPVRVFEDGGWRYPAEAEDFNDAQEEGPDFASLAALVLRGGRPAGGTCK